MTRVNYGARIVARRTNFDTGGYSIAVEHDGNDGHAQLKPGEQCECGALGLGVIKEQS
jgi:hypothetical protein